MVEVGTKISTRFAFGDELLNIGKNIGKTQKDIYLVTCDMAKTTSTDDFIRAMPSQYINVGIA